LKQILATSCLVCILQHIKKGISETQHALSNSSLSLLKWHLISQMGYHDAILVKLAHVLIDTGCSKTLIKKQHVPNGLSNAKTAMPIAWSSNAGKFNTQYEVTLTIILPEFSSSMEMVVRH
jgi:hypothetical protein